MITPSRPELSDGRRDIPATEISYAVREFGESVKRHERVLAHRMRLKPQEYQAMEHILQSRGSLGTVDLAGRLGLAVPTTTELLDRLEDAGHVVRQRDERDGRRVRLAVTGTTTAAIVATIAPMISELDTVVDSFTPEEQAVILRFLGDAARAFERQTTIDDEERDGAAPDR